MQVWASVNEADIGGLKVGTPVSFTVDAFPDESFHGVVEQVRLNAKMTQNVVLYTVVVSTDNADLKLLPYLTATLQFEIARRDGVLTVPNTALRYNPPAELIAAVATPPSADGTDRQQPPDDSQGTVWIRKGNRLAPVDVKLGVSDRVNTEIISDALKEGDEVVLGVQPAGATEQVNNPFAPRMPRSRPRS
jgi:HlyD family secretion protein